MEHGEIMLVAKITDVNGGGHDGSSRSSQQTWENGGRVGGRPVLAWAHGPLQCTSSGLLVTPCTTPPPLATATQANATTFPMILLFGGPAKQNLQSFLACCMAHG